MEVVPVLAAPMWSTSLMSCSSLEGDRPAHHPRSEPTVPTVVSPGADVRAHLPILPRLGELAGEVGVRQREVAGLGTVRDHIEELERTRGLVRDDLPAAVASRAMPHVLPEARPFSDQRRALGMRCEDAREALALQRGDR